MEKGWVSQRQHHAESGRLVRSDAFLTTEDKKAKARVRAAKGRLLTRSQGARAQQHRPF